MVVMVRKSEDPDVALVHQLPYYNDQRGFMNAIEKVSSSTKEHHLVIIMCAIALKCTCLTSQICWPFELNQYCLLEYY